MNGTLVNDQAFQKGLPTVRDAIIRINMESSLPEKCRDCKQTHMTCFTCKELENAK